MKGRMGLCVAASGALAGVASGQGPTVTAVPPADLCAPGGRLQLRVLAEALQGVVAYDLAVRLEGDTFVVGGIANVVRFHPSQSESLVLDADGLGFRIEALAFSGLNNIAPLLFGFDIDIAASGGSLDVVVGPGSLTTRGPLSFSPFMGVVVPYVGVEFVPGSILCVGGPVDEPCNAADIAPEFGVLDVNDVIDFVTAFTGGGLAADISPPGGDGLLNANDVIDFVTAFAAGCP